MLLQYSETRICRNDEWAALYKCGFSQMTWGSAYPVFFSFIQEQAEKGYIFSLRGKIEIVVIKSNPTRWTRSLVGLNR